MSLTSASPAPLTPFPLDVLMGRIVHEWETRARIFDLPTARFWSPDPDIDLSFSFLGRRAATPIGPAAGNCRIRQALAVFEAGDMRF